VAKNGSFTKSLEPSAFTLGLFSAFFNITGYVWDTGVFLRFFGKPQQANRG
jgi:hypothetical protein